MCNRGATPARGGGVHKPQNIRDIRDIRYIIYILLFYRGLDCRRCGNASATIRYIGQAAARVMWLVFAAPARPSVDDWVLSLDLRWLLEHWRRARNWPAQFDPLRRPVIRLRLGASANKRSPTRRSVKIGGKLSSLANVVVPQRRWTTG